LEGNIGVASIQSVPNTLSGLEELMLSTNEQGKRLLTARRLSVIVVLLTALATGLVLAQRGRVQEKSLRVDEKSFPVQEKQFHAQGPPPQSNPKREKLRNFDAQILANANDLLEDGRDTFRFDTFGDEAFWGGALQLQQAIKGASLGGVGPGISPATALNLGLKVDVDALPQPLINQL
jgi:hypothetical protein